MKEAIPTLLTVDIASRGRTLREREIRSSNSGSGYSYSYSNSNSNSNYGYNNNNNKMTSAIKGDAMAGQIIIDLFTTLDGVQQAPGGPEEDPEGGFRFGGWQAPLMDEAEGDAVNEGVQSMDALLLGRKTYDIFAEYWPQYADGPSDSIASVFNRIPKYVASRGNPNLSWEISHLVGPDLAAEVAAIRDRHSSIHVVGSVNFAQALVRDGLFDVLNLWVYPVVLGSGKRLFPDDGPPLGLTLLEPPIASPGGCVLLKYGPGGPVETADMDEALRER